MSTEINELMAYLEDHPTDFAGHIKLKKLIKEYGIALDIEQEAGLRAIGG